MSAPFSWVGDIHAVNSLIDESCIVHASHLQTTGTSVTVSSAAPPTAGQVLTATSATAAAWQTNPGLDNLNIYVRAASSANVDLSTDLDGASIDGVTVAAGDRVLLYGQTTTTEDGVYVIAAGAGNTARSTDVPVALDLSSAIVVVSEGTVLADSVLICTNNQGAGVVGTDDLAFDLVGQDLAQFARLGGVSGGQTLNGSTVSGENLTLAGNSAAANGSVIVSTTTGSTSASTGALVVQGGVGIAENLYVGGSLNIAGPFIAGIQYVEENLTAGGTAPDLVSRVTAYRIADATAGTHTVTLADGSAATDGFVKTIVFGQAGDEANQALEVTVTSFAPPSGGAPSTYKLTMNNIGQSYSLVWINDANFAAWYPINGGCQVSV